MAVFTSVPPAALRRFLLDYDGTGELVSLHGLADGVENTNYLVDTTTQRLILTLFEGRVQAADVPWYLAAMNALHHHGIPCPVALPRRDGNLSGMLRGRLATLVTFLPGGAIEEITPDACRQVGAFLARLHLAASTHQPPRVNSMSFTEWQRLMSRVGAQADTLQPGLAAILATELDFAASYWPAADSTNMPYGFIHGDLFPDNLFFQAGQVSGVIDFYFACHDLWAYDLAICLNAWGFDAECRYVTARGQALLAGYGQVRPLTETERAAFPALARAAALRFVATRLHDWFFTAPQAAVKRKDPLEYVARLAFYRTPGALDSVFAPLT
jgi:homoserine kinase type II